MTALVLLVCVTYLLWYATVMLSEDPE